jgi:hypothetical protein
MTQVNSLDLLGETLKADQSFAVRLEQVLPLARRSWPSGQLMSRFQMHPRDVQELVEHRTQSPLESLSRS